jgi:uncharacterized protein YbaA (DUF1428 family)
MLDCICFFFHLPGKSIMASKKYVDGFLLVVPKANVDAYAKVATKAGKLWIEHGALEYYECVGDDVDTDFGTSFPKRAKAKDDEAIIFAWIAYRSKAHRDKVNVKVMADPRVHEMMKDKPLFNMKRMSYGGFKTIVAREPK